MLKKFSPDHVLEQFVKDLISSQFFLHEETKKGIKGWDVSSCSKATEPLWDRERERKRDGQTQRAIDRGTERERDRKRERERERERDSLKDRKTEREMVATQRVATRDRSCAGCAEKKRREKERETTFSSRWRERH